MLLQEYFLIVGDSKPADKEKECLPEDAEAHIFKISLEKFSRSVTLSRPAAKRERRNLIHLQYAHGSCR